MEAVVDALLADPDVPAALEVAEEAGGGARQLIGILVLAEPGPLPDRAVQGARGGPAQTGSAGRSAL